MGIIAGKETKLYCSGEAVEMIDEATTSGDDLVYQITNSAKRVFARDAVITVDDSAVLVDPTTYTVNRLNGTITFTSVVARVITVSGQYLPLTEMVSAKEASYSITLNNEDATVFGEDWTIRATTNRDFGASISQFYVDETYAGKITGITRGNVAEAGTNTTTLVYTSHGLSVGDTIVNNTRSDASRTVTVVVDLDTVTLSSAITSQTTGDLISFYKKNPEPLVLEMWLNRDLSYLLKAWVVASSIESSSTPSSLVDESLELEGTADVDNRTLTKGTGI